MIATFKNFIENLRKYNSIAVIGLSKNAGKTTTLNSVLELLNYKNVMLTSIGYDGEDADLIFGTKKPNIFVKKDTIIATAKKCVLTSEIQFEILETTGFNTPLGEIIIARCLEDGLIELAGPSYNSQLKKVISLLKSFNKDGLVLVDGALNRKTSSNPSVCDTTILCSGMTLSNSITQVAKQTIFAVDILTLPQTKDYVNLRKCLANTITLIKNDGSQIVIDSKTTINQESIISKKLTKETSHLVLNGPLTDKLTLQLIKVRNLINELEIVVKNGTNVFIKSETFERLNKTKISIKVIEPVNICAIAMNPNSLSAKYDSKKLVDEVAKYTDIFVYDFVGGE